MYNDEYMYAIERSPEYLAHYGIRGMKWGVRKAKASGNAKRLGRQYAKAQKKLAKLEKRAAKADKYRKRAIAYGAGAAAAGGLAALGTGGVGKIVNAAGKGVRAGMKGFGAASGSVGRGIEKIAYRLPMSADAKSKVKIAGQNLQALGRASRNNAANTGWAVTKAGEDIKRWGNSHSITSNVGSSLSKSGAMNMGKALNNHKFGIDPHGTIGYKVGNAQLKTGMKIGNSRISNNTIARIGAGAIGAGLAAASAKNAYRAATAQKKAARFKSEMNKAFAGTQYANGGAPRQGKKRRRK